MANGKKVEIDTDPVIAGESVGEGKGKNNTPPASTPASTPASKSIFLNIVSIVVLIYLSLKFVAVPIIQTGINFTNKDKTSAEIVKIPDFTFPDITLLAILLLFRPQTSEIFKSIDLSSGGLKAEFKGLQDEVQEAKEDLYKQQQQQIDAMNKLQKFMYTLILSTYEIEKLRGIKDNTITSFKVSMLAAAELRRLRNSGLIRIKSNAKGISDLEKASNFGELEIDLSQHFELTKMGEEYLLNLEKILSHKNQEAS